MLLPTSCGPGHSPRPPATSKEKRKSSTPIKITSQSNVTFSSKTTVISSPLTIGLSSIRGSAEQQKLDQQQQQTSESIEMNGIEICLLNSKNICNHNDNNSSDDDDDDENDNDNNQLNNNSNSNNNCCFNKTNVKNNNNNMDNRKAKFYLNYLNFISILMNLIYHNLSNLNILHLNNDNDENDNNNKNIIKQNDNNKTKNIIKQNDNNNMENNKNNNKDNCKTNLRTKLIFKNNFSNSQLPTYQWMLMVLTFFCIISSNLNHGNGVAAEKSKHYVMSSLCKNHFLQQLYRKIDGAVLWSQNERNLDCMITFQTHSILQRFMLRFDLLQLDCNDHLYVYDGAHAVGSHKADLSCRNTKQSVGSIFTRTNFVTLKYVTDNWGTDANGFKLVITAVKDSKHSCKDFRCEYRDFCIHPDLVCDTVNHCGDNSDESTSNLCQNQEQTTLLGLELTWFVLIAVSSLLIICACIIGWAICLCRRTPRNANQNSIQLRHTAETNGSSKHLHGTLPREHTALPPMSGNLYHPAGPLGYLRIQHTLLMMAKVRPIWYRINFDN